jgi:AcrR family transcriptional regulator
MSPRPRTISDQDILSAAARVVGRVGASVLTLADVGKETGLSPATLLQRFGSKRGLLLALAAATVESVESTFARIRAEYASPVAALIASASAVAQSSDEPEELINGLTFLQADLHDPDFRRHAAEGARRIRDGYRALIEEAVSDGELADCDADGLARAVESIASGALMSWAIYRDGDRGSFIEREVVTLLRGYGRGAWANR